MGTLSNVDEIYDFDRFQMNEGVIIDKLEIIKDKYDENLHYLIANMLNYIGNRMDFSQIYQILMSIKYKTFNLKEYE